MMSASGNGGIPDLSSLSAVFSAPALEFSDESYEKLSRLRDAVRGARLSDLRAVSVDDRGRVLSTLCERCLAADPSGIKSDRGRLRDCLEVIGEIVGILLFSMEPPDVIVYTGHYLVGFLTHPFPALRVRALEHVGRTVSTPQLRANHLILKSCAICIGDEELSVATKAIAVLAAVADTPEGLDVLFDDPELVASRLKDLMRRNETVKFRVIEWAVRVASKSGAALTRCADAGFFNELLDEFRNDDVLSQLNAIQLLTDLADTPQGFEYLENQGIIQLLEASLKGHDAPMAAFIVPGLMKFFGHIGSRNPDAVLYRYPAFVEAMFSCLGSRDHPLVVVAMDTVACVGSTPAGKLALHRNGMDRYIGAIFRVVETGPSDLKVNAMDCLAQLISVKDMDAGDEVTDVTNSWFRLMQQNPLSKVVALCHQPFPDIRKAGLRILAAVASQKWGLESINSSPGLAEFLLDRGSVKDKESKEAKFAIVESIVNHPESAGIFGSVKMATFRRHHREGPFYVAAQAEVAMEGDQ